MISEKRFKVKTILGSDLHIIQSVRGGFVGEVGNNSGILWDLPDRQELTHS